MVDRRLGCGCVLPLTRRQLRLAVARAEEQYPRWLLRGVFGELTNVFGELPNVLGELTNDFGELTNVLGELTNILVS